VEVCDELHSGLIISESHVDWYSDSSVFDLRMTVISEEGVKLVENNVKIRDIWLVENVFEEA
jgi:hypothetical protein